MCYQFSHVESSLFTPKTQFFNEFSQHHWQESFNCDSFVSQSRFDIYAVAALVGNVFKVPMKTENNQQIFESNCHGLLNFESIPYKEMLLFKHLPDLTITEFTFSPVWNRRG